MIRSIPRPLVRTNQWVIVLSALISLIFGQGWFLLLPLISGMMGFLFGYNPVMRIAKLFLKKKPGEYLPEDWEQQQFNQKIAVICLVLGFLGFTFKWTIVAYVFTTLVALAAFIAILGFCVGCFIHYQWKLYLHRRSN